MKNVMKQKIKQIVKKIAIVTAFIAVSSLSFAQSSGLTNLDWSKVEKQAKGQTVYFYAWGGSQQINDYLRWVDKQLQQQFDVRLQHVKVNDISTAISRLLAEKAAGKTSAGTIDMVWINGENFKNMKQNQLITQPFVQQLPNWQFVNTDFPVNNDFTEPTEGLEAPWGIGQLIFIHDKKRTPTPPTSMTKLLQFAKQNPNKFSYPQPPSFHGTGFLKTALLELVEDPALLYQAVDKNTFSKITNPLWQYLDQLHPVSWHQGKQFPTSSAHTLQLLDDGELDLAISFNPNEVSSAQSNGTLADTTDSYAMTNGALSNIHFLSIPFNANAKEGALVAINFLLSPVAQSKKGDLKQWGDPSVLKKQYISGSAANTKLFKSVAEPHPSWQAALEQEWQKRYGH
ncbi:ABC transporter substrate-binding protein [Psychromonas hadalis]|uniref:ABC transporter substrate-binding protein n=1 Tax=Psychromonas hadalis TaxID=211669 RepID=UPI0003B4B8DE|nr:ABC transporter substrate-binding protein [Psychromonas hadalis]